MDRQERRQSRQSRETSRSIDTAKIAARAYALFLERQKEGRPGDQLSDWYAAEQELRARKVTTP